jgi:hypothetical protein
MQEDKENKIYDDEQEELIENNLDENISLVLLSRLNNICLKLAKNIDLLLRTPFSFGVSSIKQSHPIQRHESNASSISKQSTNEDIIVHDTTNIVYEEIIDKLNNDLELMKIHLTEQEFRMYVKYDFIEIKKFLFFNSIEKILKKNYLNVNQLIYQLK